MVLLDLHKDASKCMAAVAAFSAPQYHPARGEEVCKAPYDSG